MHNDTESHRYGPRYAAYIEHLKDCGECGRKRCPVGAELCADYLAGTRAPVMPEDALPHHRDEEEAES